MFENINSINIFFIIQILITHISQLNKKNGHVIVSLPRNFILVLLFIIEKWLEFEVYNIIFYFENRWFREEQDQLLSMNVGDRVNVLAAGLLRINKVRLEDRGKYLCWVNNSAGEETVQVTLTVTGILKLLNYSSKHNYLYDKLTKFESYLNLKFNTNVFRADAC